MLVETVLWLSCFLQQWCHYDFNSHRLDLHLVIESSNDHLFDFIFVLFSFMSTCYKLESSVLPEKKPKPFGDVQKIMSEHLILGQWVMVASIKFCDNIELSVDQQNNWISNFISIQSYVSFLFFNFSLLKFTLSSCLMGSCVCQT